MPPIYASTLHRRDRAWGVRRRRAARARMRAAVFTAALLAAGLGAHLERLFG
jgi:hypothetical protein